MDNTLTDTRPRFARLTEGRATQSWRSAAPAVLVLVAFVALLAYLASGVSSYSQKAMMAQRDADQAREQVTSMTKQEGRMQGELALARDPGRVAVILQAAAPEKPAKGKKAEAPPALATPAPWAAATWGEANDGKTWLRVDAYGLAEHPDNGAYHAWMTPASGDPIDLGIFDVNSSGSGYLFASNLPAVDQGKSLALTLDPQSKQMGQVLAQADLPKLVPTHSAAEPPPTDQAAPQAKTGETTQQMHQEGK
jgi:anti-sigma-K factor RskA